MGQSSTAAAGTGSDCLTGRNIAWYLNEAQSEFRKGFGPESEYGRLRRISSRRRLAQGCVSVERPSEPNNRFCPKVPWSEFIVTGFFIEKNISSSFVETVGNSKGVVQAVWVTRSVIHKAAVSTKTNWQATSCKIYYNHRLRVFADPEPRKYWWYCDWYFPKK